MVDVESDGPVPGLYSMVSFGAVGVTAALDRSFCGRLRPVSEKWIPEALLRMKRELGLKITLD